MNNTLSLPYLILIVATVFSACRGPEAKQHENENENTESASTGSLTQVASEKYAIDTKESEVTWYGSMLITSKGSHTGYVSISKGELLIEKGGKLTGGTVVVDMNTISDEKHGTENNLVDHLKSADFFEVEKFPFSAFAITMVVPSPDETVNVTGNLTIKGITHAVTFPAKIEVNNGVVHATGNVSIDEHYGMSVINRRRLVWD